MRLQVVRAIYKGGGLIFAQPELTPRNGTEVILTCVDEAEREQQPAVDSTSSIAGTGERRAVNREVVTVQTRG